MRTVPIRDLQQHASAVLRSVRAGERVGVTDRGVIVAVLVPPGAAGGAAGLMAAGRVHPAVRTGHDRKKPRRQAPETTADVLDDVRADRN